MIAHLAYYDGMKVYYRADIANYDATNTISLLEYRKEIPITRSERLSHL